jgi:hypothetical protein
MQQCFPKKMLLIIPDKAREPGKIVDPIKKPGGEYTTKFLAPVCERILED